MQIGNKALVCCVTNLNFYQYYLSIMIEAITLEKVNKLDAR